MFKSIDWGIMQSGNGLTGGDNSWGPSLEGSAGVDVFLLPDQGCLSSKSSWIAAGLMHKSFAHSSWSLDKCAFAYWGFQK